MGVRLALIVLLVVGFGCDDATTGSIGVGGDHDAGADASGDTAQGRDTVADDVQDVGGDTTPDAPDAPDTPPDTPPDADMDAEIGPDAPVVIDEDDDGFAEADDCDDHNAEIHPDADEVCGDTVDNNCDGDADAADVACRVELCGDIAEDTVWDAAHLHVVTCDIHVGADGSCTLTVEDGARVEFRRNVGLYVGTVLPGKIVVDGLDSGVTFTSRNADPAPGDWTGVAFGYDDAGSTLAGLTLEYAGAEGVAAVGVEDASPALTDCAIRHNLGHGIEINHGATTLVGCSITDNAADGVHIVEGGLDRFEGNVLTGNGRYPAQLPAPAASALDATSSYIGNAQDQVRITSGHIRDDAVWVDLDVRRVVDGAVTVADPGGASLTLGPGSVVLFEAGGVLRVAEAEPGRLTIDGAEAPVILRSAAQEPAAGDWVGVHIGPEDTGSVLDGMHLSHAGQGPFGCLYALGATIVVRDAVISDCANQGIYLNTGAALTLRDSTVERCATDGVFVSRAASLFGDSPAFSSNVLRENGGYPASIPATWIAELGPSNSFAGNGIERISITGGDVAQSGTWRTHDVPYEITGGFSIRGPDAPVLRVEDGARFEAAQGVAIYVGTSATGTLDIDATEVVFTSAAAEPAPGDWQGFIFSTLSDASRLRGVTVEYAGDTDQGAVTVYQSNLRLDESTIRHSGSWGLYLWTNAGGTVTGTTLSDNARGGAFFANTSEVGRDYDARFTGNRLVDNGGPAVELRPAHLREFDADNVFLGNAEDRILVGGGILTQSATWHAFPAGYHVTHGVYVQHADTPILTLSPGVRLYFDQGAQLSVGDGAAGGLVAVGTAELPILMTSSTPEPAPGAWFGLKLGAACETGGVQVAHTRILYGGSSDWGGVWWSDCDGAITDSHVAHSSSWGMFRLRSNPLIERVTYENNADGDLR